MKTVVGRVKSDGGVRKQEKSPRSTRSDTSAEKERHRRSAGRGEGGCCSKTRESGVLRGLGEADGRFRTGGASAQRGRGECSAQRHLREPWREEGGAPSGRDCSFGAGKEDDQVPTSNWEGGQEAA